MPFSDQFTNQQKLDALVNGWFEGGGSTLYGASWQKLIDDVPRRVWAATVTRTAPDGTAFKVNALQELADTKTAVLALQAQVAELAARPAATVTLTDAQVSQLAAVLGPDVVKALADQLNK